MKRAIIGAGIGGLSLVDGLVRAGGEPSEVVVIDGGSGRRGSSVPMAMIHPFQGRSMALRRGQGPAFVRSWRILEGWAQVFGGEWWRPQPMLRPLSEDDRGRLMEESWLSAREGYLAPIQVERWEAAEIEARFDGLAVDVPGLVYGPAAAVDLPRLLEALRGSLSDGGVQFLEAQMVGLARDGAQWAVELSTGEELLFDEVILAMGAALGQFFPLLDMRRRAGEVAILDPGEGELSVMISAGKHLAELPCGLWGLGSTYYSAREEPERDDEEVMAELVAGVVELVPAVARAEVVEIWRGERGVYGADNLPVIGPVPDQPGLYCFGAFGSKGLLWAPSAAQDLARELLGGEAGLSSFVDIRRIRPRRLLLPPALKGAQKSSSSTLSWKLSGISC